MVLRAALLGILGLALSLPSVAAVDGVPAEIATEWDLTRLYDDVAAWQADYEALKADLPSLAAPAGSLTDSADTLATALDAQSDYVKRLTRTAAYAFLSADTDLRDPDWQARRVLMQQLWAQYGETVAYVRPEILRADAETIRGYIAADPRLEKHSFFLENVLRKAPHVLGEEAERVLAAMGLVQAAPNDIYELLANADMPWPTITLADGQEVFLNQAGYTKHRGAPLRQDRIAVFDAFWGALGAYESTMGAILNGHVQGQVVEARQRNYDSALSKALAEDNLPETVYRSLVAEVNAGLPSFHRYLKLRQRMLGLPDMQYYDIYPRATTLETAFDISAAASLTRISAAPLGDDYLARYSQALGEARMHVYPAEGKRSGAYMAGYAYQAGPFILLNHNDNFESVSTFAHEWGHALHTLYTIESQPFETRNYSTFIAEIAAIAQEILLQDHMIATAETDAEKLYYLDYALEQVRGTFFRQTMFAEFELAIHEAVERGEALTGARLTALYGELVQRYHGHADGVLTVAEPYHIEWAYIPHFYYDFYVFQYSTSLAAAAEFVRRIQDGAPGAVETYLDVLRAGGSDYPYDILMRAGIDMASPEPYRAVVSRMEAIMDEVEAILDRQGR